MARRPGAAVISRPVSPPSWRVEFLTETAVSVNLFEFSVQKMVEKSKPAGKAEEDLEIVPDAWERFERAVDTVIKSGPMHRQRPEADRKERPASKGRVHKGKSRD
jgi:hypothetical protein